MSDAWSQTKTINRSNQQWLQYYGQLQLPKKWVLSFDGGFRWKDGDKLLYIGRAGLGYQLKERLRLSAGFATQGTFQNDKLNTIEYRPYQELFHLLFDKKVLIQQRLRVEERFFYHLVTDSHDFNFRYRYQITSSIPIVSLSQSRRGRRLALLISEEVFFNSGPKIVYNSFDRNRIVVGPSIHFSESISLAISYMYQFSKLNAPGSYTSDHVAWLTVRHTLRIKPTAEFD